MPMLCKLSETEPYPALAPCYFRVIGLRDQWSLAYGSSDIDVTDADPRILCPGSSAWASDVTQSPGRITSSFSVPDIVNLVFGYCERIQCERCGCWGWRSARGSARSSIQSQGVVAAISEL